MFRFPLFRRASLVGAGTGLMVGAGAVILFFRASIGSTDDVASKLSLFLPVVLAVFLLFSLNFAYLAIKVLPRLWSRVGASMVRGAAGALPRERRARYVEEWRGELYDLRAEGARWWQRAGYLATILLYVAPVLAVTLRLSRTKAVD
ncbi:hypothetical protein ACWKSP_28770 [Micromonosporaceae bacterium Da 78-11]